MGWSVHSRFFGTLGKKTEEIGVLVSVVMPAFNAAPYIESALLSLVHQTGDFQLDICVIDDGSTDATCEIVRRMMADHSEIRLFSIPHQGISKARNTGLANISPHAEFVTFLDSDDLAYPNRISRQLKKLQDDPNVLVVYGLLHLFHELDAATGRPPSDGPATIGLGLQLSVALFRRCVIEQIGWFDETLHYAEDVDYLFRLLESGMSILVEDEVATFYRRHDANVTNDVSGNQREFMKAVLMSAKRRKASGDVKPLDSSMFAGRRRLEASFRSVPQ